MLLGSLVLPEAGRVAHAQTADTSAEIRRALEELRRAVGELSGTVIDARKELARVNLEEAEAKREEASRGLGEAEREASSATEARRLAATEAATARARADVARPQLDAAGSAATGGPVRSLDDFWAAYEEVVRVMETTPCSGMSQEQIQRYNRATAGLNRANQWAAQAVSTDPSLQQRIESDPRAARLQARMSAAQC